MIEDSEIQPPETRSRLILTIAALYFIPVIALSYYSLELMPYSDGWTIFSIGLFIALVGSIAFFLRLHRWETNLFHDLKETFHKALPPVEPTPIVVHEPVPISDPIDQERLIEEAVSEWQQKHTVLVSEVAEKDSELENLHSEMEQLQHQLQVVTHEFSSFQRGVQIQIEQKEELISQLKQTSNEQRLLIEKHQQHIAILETKEKDLSYEIKTLLHLSSLENIFNDKPSASKKQSEFISYTNQEDFQGEEAQPNPFSVNERSPFHVKLIDTPESATSQLKHCLDVATKMTGANYLIGGSSKIHNLTLDNYALDLRRLCDALNSENNAYILLYSQKENKILFANDLTKNALGWAQDKFSDSFHEIVSGGMDEWKRGLNQLATENSAMFSLTLKSKAGVEMPLQCHLGAVPAGTFRHHVVGILYESKQEAKK
jgi:hypothetical protein